MIKGNLMTLIIGIYFSLIGLLDPANRTFFLIRNLYLVGLAYLCLILLVFHLDKITRFSKKCVIMLIVLSYSGFIPTLIYSLNNPNYEISQYMRVLLHVPIVLYVIIHCLDLRKYLINFSFLFNGIALYQLLLLNQVGRVGSLFSHPNFYSIYLTVIVVFILEQIVINREKKNIFHILYIVLILFIILFGTGARASFAIIIGLLIFTLLLLTKNKVKSIVILCCLGMLGLGIFYLFRETLMTTRIFDMHYGHRFENQVNSFEWRELRWRAALDGFFDSNILAQIFGTGWQSSPFVSRRFYGFSMHNEYLRILIDFGIAGLVSYIIVLFNLLKLGFQRKREEGYFALTLLLVLIIVASYTENIFVSSESFSILVGTLATTLGIINKDKMAQQKDIKINCLLKT